MISKELQNKLDYFEQVYFSMDSPLPFKDDLTFYPVTVEKYYDFYSALPCITKDKSIKIIKDEHGRDKKITDVKGLTQNYLTYLINRMKNEEEGAVVTQQVISLFSLVFQITPGMFCPECGKRYEYSEILNGVEDYAKEQLDQAQRLYSAAVAEQESQTGEIFENHDIPDDLKTKIILAARQEYLSKALVCNECGGQLRDIFSLRQENGKDQLCIYNTIITPDDFDELKAIIPRQNIYDYDGDKYINPDLKEELEIKQRLQNSDYTSPTLEKQLVCVSIGTGFPISELKKLPMRKLSLYLKLIDKKETYYTQLLASMCGLVKFKQDPQHWIFSDDKKNIKDELTEYSAFEKKFKDVV